jgi:hypothetical protein
MKHYYGFDKFTVDELGEYVGEPKRFDSIEERNSWLNNDYTNRQNVSRAEMVKWFNGVQNMNKYFSEVR